MATNAPATFLVPVKIAGKLIGYNPDTMTALRGDDVTVTFDLTHANAHFGRFTNATGGKDKVAPAYNLLSALVVPEDKDALQERLANPKDEPAIMIAVGELSDIIIPSVEKTVKNSLSVSS